jgi:acyl-CoA synthetase (AMP-forming)/AMP-acid ligase II
VFATPHPHLGQVPRAQVAFATPSPDLDGLRAHCARALSPYKVPVEFTVVEATAKTPGGKILRRSGESAVPAELS